jgi:peptidoglycan/LPS O-acetylase OafA/YrhL
MAGTDIAEITQVGVEAVTSRLAPLLKTDRRAGLLALLGMAANLAAAWGVVHTMGWMSGKDLHDEAVALISMAVGGMLLWGLVANNKKLQVSAHLSYGSLLLYVAMYMLVMLIFVVGDAMYAMVVQHSLRYDQVDFDVLLDRFAAFLLPLLTMGLFVLFLRHGRRSVKAFRVFGFATCAALFACALFRRDGSSSVLFGHGVVLGSLVLMVLGTRLPWLRHQWRALCRLLFIANVSFAVLQLVALIFRAGPGKVEGQAALSAVIVGMALGCGVGHTYVRRPDQRPLREPAAFFPGRFLYKLHRDRRAIVPTDADGVSVFPGSCGRTVQLRKLCGRWHRVLWGADGLLCVRRAASWPASRSANGGTGHAQRRAWSLTRWWVG